MPALKVEILTTVDSAGLTEAVAGVRGFRDEVAAAATAAEPLSESAAAAAESLAATAEAATPAADGLAELGDTAEQASAQLQAAGDSAAWTAQSIQAVAPKLDADPLVAYAQAAGNAADALDDDAAGLISFARGAEGAAASVKPLAAATKEQAASSSAAGVQTEKLGQILGGFAAASKGGTTGVLGLSTGIRALWTTISAGTGGVGLVIALATALGGLALGFLSTEEAAEKVRKKLEELNQAKLDLAVQQQKDLEEATQKTLRALEAQAIKNEEIADRTLALRKAETRAAAKDSGEDPAVTERKLLALERAHEDEKRAEALKLAQAKLAEIEKLEYSTAQAAADATEEWQKQKGALEELTAAREAWKSAYAVSAAEGATGDDFEAFNRATARYEAAVSAAQKYNETTVAAAQKASQDAAAKAKDKLGAATRAREDTANLQSTQEATTPLIRKTRAEEDRAKRDLTDAEKAKIEEQKKKAREIQEFRMRELGPDVVANRIAGGDSTLDPTIAAALFPNRKFAAPSSTPSIASTPFTPGGGVYRPGEALPTNTTGVYRAGERLPGSTLGAANQMTRGQLAPGSDNKQFQQSAEQINESMTKAAKQEVPDLKPAADAAETLVTKGEELAAAIQQTGESMVQSFGAVATQQGQIVAVQGNQQGQITQILAKIRAHDAAIASLRQRSQAA